MAAVGRCRAPGKLERQNSQQKEEHQAKAESDSGSAAKKSSVLADDLDCAFCHLGCVQPCASQTASVAAIRSAVLALPTLLPPDSGRPGRIERPKWFLAA